MKIQNLFLANGPVITPAKPRRNRIYIEDTNYKGFQMKYRNLSLVFEALWGEPFSQVPLDKEAEAYEAKARKYRGELQKLRLSDEEFEARELKHRKDFR